VEKGELVEKAFAWEGAGGNLWKMRERRVSRRGRSRIAVNRYGWVVIFVFVGVKRILTAFAFLMLPMKVQQRWQPC
jgi:hypothetical protein